MWDGVVDRDEPSEGVCDSDKNGVCDGVVDCDEPNEGVGDSERNRV